MSPFLHLCLVFMLLGAKPASEHMERIKADRDLDLALSKAQSLFKYRDMDITQFNSFGFSLCKGKLWLQDDNIIDEIITRCYQPLGDNDDNSFGHVVVYNNLTPKYDMTGDGLIDSKDQEILGRYIATVVQVEDGFTKRVLGKFGFSGFSHHHPRDPGIGYTEFSIENSTRTYYQPRYSGCCVGPCCTW